MISPYLTRPLRTLAQVRGDNVLRPSSWSPGDNPPRVLIRAPKIDTTFDEDNVIHMRSCAQ
jgi:hypothetical protein